MLRFQIKPTTDYEGHRVLFETDNELTVRKWIEMQGFYACDQITGKALRAQEDLDHALGIAPIVHRDFGVSNDLYEDDDWDELWAT